MAAPATTAWRYMEAQWILSARRLVVVFSLLSAVGCGEEADDAHLVDSVLDEVLVAEGDVAAEVEVCPGEPAEEPPACMTYERFEEGQGGCTTYTLVVDAEAEGSSCSIDGGAPGECREGSCVAIEDPGAEGSSEWQEASASLSTGDGGVIPLTIMVPEGSGPFPVVVFIHGFSLDPSYYLGTARHLASWGFVVVLPALPGTPLEPVTHAAAAGYLVELLDWLDAEGEDGEGPLEGKAAKGQVAMAGHSMGGKLSMLVAAWDTRPVAVLGLDPVDAGPPVEHEPEDYPSVTPELMDEVAIPLALVGETTNAEGDAFSACAPAEDNFHQYFVHAASPAIEVELLGANHMSFLDDPDCGLPCLLCAPATADHATSLSLTRRIMTAFFLVTLSERPAFRHYLTGPAMADAVDQGLVTTTTANGF